METPTRILCLALLTLSALAVAQPAPVTAGITNSNGFKVGEGRLHLYLELEGHFNSAAGFFDSQNPLVVSPELVAYFRPGTRYELATPSTRVNFNGNVGYALYTGLLSSNSRAASHVEAAVGLDTAFNQDGAVEFQVGDNLTRSDRTQNAALSIGVLSLYNSLRAALPIHPGGRALEFTPSLTWGVELFDPLAQGDITQGNCDPTDASCNSGIVSQMNYSNLNANFNTRWRFFPKTALTVDVGYDWRTYFSGASGTAAARLLSGTAGMVGLISSHISVTAKLGWAHDFSNSGASTLLAQAELAYLHSNFSVRAGYLRTVQPVPVYGTNGDDRGYLEGQFETGRFKLIGSGTFDYLTFYGTQGRKDMVVSASLSPQYAITTFFSVAVGYNFQWRTSTANSLASQFTRHEAFLRLTVAY